MSTVKTRWVYGSLGATENKSVSRSATPKDTSYECSGFDTAEEGTLRPFPGFLKVHDLGPSGGYSDLLNGSDSTGNHDQTSRILDLFPVNFRIGTDNYAYGFVYRVQRKTSQNTVSDVYMDHWSSGTGSWTRGTLMKEDVPVASQMSVSVWGRFVYVMVEGEDPSMGYATTTSTGAITRLGHLSTSTTFPGPGLRPTLLPPEKGSLIGSIQSLSSYPGRGQIALIATAPSGLNVYGSCTGGTGGTGTGSSITAFTCCVGGTDTAPQADSDTRKMASGAYAFAYYLYDSRTGRRSALSDIAYASTSDFTTGGVTTDRYIVLELTYDKTLYDQAYVYRSVRVEGVGTTYTAGVLQLDKIITLANYETCKSSLASYGAGVGQVVYYYQLEDKALVYQPVYQDSAFFDDKMPRAGASILYEGTMILGKVSGNATTSTSIENRPDDVQRGQGEIRYSSLVYSNPELFPPGNRYMPPIPTNEVIAFRGVGGNVIGWSRDRQYYGRKDSNYIRFEPIHEGFGITGYRAVDTIGSMGYFMTSKGLKSVDAQGQLEEVKSLNKLIMGEWTPASLVNVSIAYDPAMSSLFVLNPTFQTAAVLNFNTGKVGEVGDLPFSIAARGVWPLLNSDGSTTPANTPLVERAFFVKDIPLDPFGTEVDAGFSNYQPKVYVVNKDRQLKKTCMGNPLTTACSLLPMDYDCYFTVTGTSLVDLVHVTVNGGISSSAIPQLPTDVEGAYLYVISSPIAAYVGKKQQIISRDSRTSPDRVTLYLASTTDIDNDPWPLNGMPAGTRVVISPICARWVTFPLVQETGEQQFASVQDHFRMKHVDQIGLIMTAVSGTPLSYPVDNTDIQHTALLYRGDEATPSFTATPRDRDGNAISTLREGETVYWSAFGQSGSQKGRYGVQGALLVPGVQIITADVDYRVVAMSVMGEISDTMVSQLPS